MAQTLTLLKGHDTGHRQFCQVSASHYIQIQNKTKSGMIHFSH